MSEPPNTVSGMRLLMQAAMTREARLAAPLWASADDIVGQWARRWIEQMAHEDAVRRMHETVDRMADDASFDIWLACARWRAEVDGKHVNRSVAARLHWQRRRQ